MSESGPSSSIRRDLAQHAADQAESDAQEFRVVCFTVIPYVPVGADRHALAQRLADHLCTLTREGTGEVYPVAADVFVVKKSSSWMRPARRRRCCLSTAGQSARGGETANGDT